MLASYPRDFVLISPAAKACGSMRARQEWKLIRHDQDAALFARSDSPAALPSGEDLAGAAALSYSP